MKKILLSLLFLTVTASVFAQNTDEQQAVDLFQKGKLTEAVTAFEKILAAKPNHLNAINALGMIYLELGKNSEAYSISSKGLTLYPKDDNVTINKARAAVKIGKTDEAIALMDVCIGRDAGFFMPYHIKGTALDAQNRVQLAIGMYSKAIQLNPNFPNAYLERGNDFAAISRYPQAIADYDKVLSLTPQSNEAYNMRGVANYQLEKYDHAIADYTKAIALGNFNALTNRGVLYLDLNKIDLAKADFNKAINLNPKQADDAYYNLADVLNKEKQPNEALINIDKAIVLQPKSALYHAMRANILLSLNKDIEALAATGQVLLLEPKNRDGFIFKATALSNLKRYEEAVKTMTSGINEHPDFYLMYSLRAFIYKQMGKIDLANIDNAKAKELGVKN